jgi:putative transposase
VIQVQLKLKLTPRQERQLNHWLRHLQSVWNWGVRKIEQDAQGGVFYSSLGFQKLLNTHGAKIGIAQDAISGTLETVHTAWRRCFKKCSRKPRLKGRRNKLNSIAFGHGTRILNGDRLHVQVLGRVRFHRQSIPEGHIGQFRIVKRASGWYACLFIQAEPNAVPRIASGQLGIDPGFKSLLTLSTGEKVAHPRELEASALRLGQAQRGNNRKLTARLQERINNQRKDRNHKLSRRLISENILIAFSKDNIKGISKRFGKSVQSSGHAQLRSMLSYKASRTGDTIYVEPESKHSTMRCSNCQALTGPTGLRSLAVRRWVCPCGTEHDRDVNAAINTLIAGAGMVLELSEKAA